MARQSWPNMDCHVSSGLDMSRSRTAVTGDKLRDYLLAKGHDTDPVDEVCERAALLEHLAGKSRWKAGIDAQRMHLGKVEVQAHDI
jgi:hypothetical protein